VRQELSVSAPVYLTPTQVADLLQVSVKTVSRWALEDASMPALRRGRVLRFEREQLLAWLDRQLPRAARRSQRNISTRQVEAQPDSLTGAVLQRTGT
jgi:excisionase family DNA binding protein